MADKTLTGTIKQRQGTATEWESKNPTLAAGEFGYDTTNKQTKIGDGVTPWNDLDWFATKSKPTFAESDWATIAEVINNGNAAKYFAVGDKKTIALSTGEEVTVVILGFEHDDLADGSGKAAISIGMENCLATTYAMNSSNTNVGGWESSIMRTETMATLLSQLPSDLQSLIKSVSKKATVGGGSSSTPATSVQTSTDKLFLLAEVEIDGTTTAGYADEGTQYEYWKTVKDGTVAADRIKYLSNGGGSAVYWWLRSPSATHSTYFRFIGTTGIVSYGGASGTRGVSFGFCI